MDIFKQGRVPIEINKPLPEKVTSLQHVDDKHMLKAADTSFGYQHKKTWSTEMMEFGQGKNVTTRLFDKVVEQSFAREAANEDRARKLKEYYEQPQRGTFGKRPTE